MKNLKIVPVFLLLTLTACAAATIKKQWKDPAWHGSSISSVLVYCATDSNTLRSFLEDAFVEKLEGAGVKATRSYGQLPSTKTSGDLIIMAKANGAQAIVTTRLLNFEFNTEIWRDPPGSDFHKWYGGAGPKSTQYNVVEIEISVWDVNTNKLVWTANTDRVATKDIQRGARDVAATFISRLKTDGIIR